MQWEESGNLKQAALGGQVRKVSIILIQTKYFLIPAHAAFD